MDWNDVTPLVKPGESVESGSAAPTTWDAVQAEKPKTQDPSWFDQTVGAAAYGGADVASHVLHNVGETFGSDTATDWAKELDSFKADHPQYAPEEVHSAWDLITNPKALVGRVAGMAPYVIATGAISEIPIAGPWLAGGLVYSIESERAYRSALQDGASEEEATKSARISGVVNGGLQLLMVKNLMGFMSGGEQNLASSIGRLAMGQANALGAVGNAASFLGKQAVIQMLQGGANELIPLGVYGKPVAEGFVDRRLQDAVGAVAAGEIFGPIGRSLKGEGAPAVDQEGKVQSEPEGAVRDLDVVTPDHVSKILQAKGYDAEQADALAKMYDARASVWARSSGRKKEEFYVRTPAADQLPDRTTTQGGSVSEQSGQMAGESEKKASTGQEAQKPTEQLPPVSEQIATEGEEILRALRAGEPEVPGAEEKAPESGGKPVSGEESVSKEQAQKLLDLTEVKTPVDNIRETLGGLWNIMKGDLQPEEAAALEKAFPSKGKKTPQDGRVVDALMRYVWNGNAPDIGLAKAFDSMQEWIKGNWGSLKEAGIKTKLSADQQIFLDNLLYKDSPVISQKRGEIAMLQKELDGIKGQEGSPDAEEYLNQRRQLQMAQDALKRSQRELQRAQLSRFDPTASPEGVGMETFRLPEQWAQESEANKVLRNSFQKFTDEFSRYLVSAKNSLMNFRSGQKLVNLISDAFTAKQNHVGFWESEKGAGDLSRQRVLSGLGLKERQWLVSSDQWGESNQRRLIDDTAEFPLRDSDIPEDLNKQSIRQYVKAVNARNRYFGERAEAAGLVIKRKDGAYVPFEQPDGQRFPRMMKPEVRQSIIKGSGPTYDAVAEAVLKLNPEMQDLGGAKEALQKDYSDTDVRKSSSLEYTRKIKNMPDVVEVGGKKIAVMHLEPTDVLGRMVENQGSRLEFARRLGQASLKDLEDPQLKKLGSILGIDSGLGKETLQNQLLKTGFSKDQVQNQKYSELKYNVGQMGLELGKPMGQLVDEIMGSAPTELSKTQVKQLASWAKEVGGIKPESGFQQKKGFDVTGDETTKVSPVYDPQELLNKVKQRITQKTNNNLDLLLNSLQAEGGNAQHASDVLKVSQGLPFHWLADTPLTRVAKLTSDVLGAMQTTFAVIPHTLFSAVQIPQLGGARNYLEALHSVISAPEGNRDAMILATGLHRAELTWRAEPGYSLSRIGQLLRTGLGKATGLDYINEKNKQIAYETFRGLADDWRENGIAGKDVLRAKAIGLSQEEVAATNSEKGMSDLTYSKVIQQGLGASLFAYDRPFNKGLVESWPLMKGLFAYNTYVFGNTRANLGLLQDLKDSFASGDVKQVLGQTQRLGAVLAGSLGSGALTMMFREAIKGQSDKHVDDTWWDTMSGALNESAGLGMFHRMTDAFKYNGGVIERTAFGLTPQVSALTHLLGAALGYGRYGQLGFGERMEETLKQQAPAIRAFETWVNKVAYPQQTQYEETKASMGKWMRENLPQSGMDAADSQVNPDYYHIHDQVMKGDLPEAQKEAIALFQRKLQSGDDPARVVQDLRTSLINKAPLDISTGNLVKFLSTLDEKRRVQFVRNQLDYVSRVDQVAPTLR